MTIEEKRELIRVHCSNTSCSVCKLCHVPNCFNHAADIERNYAILFGEGSEPDPSANPDNVNHPKHYGGGKFECIDVMVETQGVEAVKSFCLCNAFKYLWRHSQKESEVSIDKALWYLQKYVELRDGK